MSSSLLKQSLEIVESHSSLTLVNHGKSKRKAQNPFAPSSAKDQLPEHRAVIKTKRKSKHEVASAGKQLHGKSAIQQAHDNIRNNQNKTEENLKKLLMFSSVKLDEKTTNKLIRRAQNKKYVIDIAKSEAEQASVFTEEDFAKFEREYFVG